MTVGDDITDQAERVTEHVAHEVRHRDPEILRALPQLGLEALGDPRVDHALLPLVVGVTLSSLSLRLRVTM